MNRPMQHMVNQIADLVVTHPEFLIWHHNGGGGVVGSRVWDQVGNEVWDRVLIQVQRQVIDQVGAVDRVWRPR